MNEMLIAFIGIYIVLELFEILWQRANSMLGMLIKMHHYYKKHALLFFMMHPTYVFMIYLLLCCGASLPLVVMLLIKSVDIVTKIVLMRQLFEKHELSDDISAMLLAPLHPLMPFIGLAVYPPFIFFAFNT